ncbi:cation:proton antiporter [Desulfobacterota bacterium AH_259_B03_O07]|nr:cation:proton antiporter [Desulfobacterota bacterium AH_259_B03_O07]
MNIPILSQIVIIFGLSIAVIFIFSRLRVPTILGFLLTGIIAGPHALGLVKAVNEVEILAEIGVVMLLFAIGIEFSIKNLLQIKRAALLGGGSQVLLTIFITFLVLKGFGRPLGEAVFIGFLISLSSTAIVLKLLQERTEIDSPHGRTTLGILIFQDIIVVPMILITPILSGSSNDIGASILIILVKGVLIILLVIVSAKWIVPWLLYQITRTRSRELFLLSILVICLAVAWLTSSLGLSLAMGAFLAGLTISESEYSHEALSNVLPFRDIFTSFFFVSIGMLLDIGFIVQKPLLIAIIVLGVLVLKVFTASSAVIISGFPLRTAILVGLALCQIGEFSFILSKVGVDFELLNVEVYQMFLSVTVLTMAATPFIILLAPRISDFVVGLPMPERLRSGLYPLKELGSIQKKEALIDHLVIVGHGINGRNLARAAKVAGIPYVIIDMNPDTVKEEQAKGEPINYGDATQESVLKLVGITDARVIVIAISDPAATRRIASIARKLHKNIHIITRTRFVQEMKPLFDLGADEVIPEEFETSVEIFTRVLMKYLIPDDEIKKFINEVRSDGYEMFRSLSKSRSSLSDLSTHLSNVEICTLRVTKDSSLVNKSIAEIGFRKNYGVTILAIRTDSIWFPNPGGDQKISANDTIILLGTPDRIVDVSSKFGLSQ